MKRLGVLKVTSTFLPSSWKINSQIIRKRIKQMKNLLFGNTEYEEMLKRYSLKDGIKALAFFA